MCSTARLLPGLWLSAVLLCGLGTALEAQPEPAPSGTEQAEILDEPAAVPESRRSARATMRTFLEAFAEEPPDYDQAISTLELDFLGLQPDAQRVAGRDLATQLKDVIDRLAFVEFEVIPDAPEAPSYVFAELGDQSIQIARTESGDWRFTSETISALPALLAAVADRDLVAGVEEAPRTPSLWLRSRMPESLRGRAFLLENWQWLGLFTLILLGIVLDRLVVFLLRAGIGRQLAERLAVDRDAEAVRNSLRPLGLLVMSLVWWLGLLWLGLPSRPLAVLLIAVKFVAMASLVWVASRMVDVLAAWMTHRAAATDTRFDDLLVPLVRKSLKVFVVAVGIVFLASNIGADVTGLVAGLGLGGLAFALAAQDTVKNLFGSLTVLLDRPFQVGDWVVVGNVEGTVEEVGFRSTRVRTFYNSMITLPNAKLIDTPVDNYGARTYRRFKTTVGIAYDTSPERIDAFTSGVRELVRRHPYTRKDSFHVYLNEFGPSSLDVLLYIFFETPDWATELRERHRLMVDILRLAARLEVEIAFPTQTVHLHKAGQAEAQEAVTTAATAAVSYGDAADDAKRLGRNEARALLEASLRGEVPPPVSTGIEKPGEDEKA